MVSFISGKSNNSDTVIPKPRASLCKVFSLGFFVFPDMIFSTVDCVMPDKVTSVNVKPSAFLSDEFYGTLEKMQKTN